MKKDLTKSRQKALEDLVKKLQRAGIPISLSTAPKRSRRLRLARERRLHPRDPRPARDSGMDVYSVTAKSPNRPEGRNAPQSHRS
jgi:hypothetical protein